jgi:hypothetical protein
LITLVHSLKHSSAPLGPSIHFSKIDLLKNSITSRCWWLTPIIIALQKAQIRRIMVAEGSGKGFKKSQGWISTSAKFLLAGEHQQRQAE